VQIDQGTLASLLSKEKIRVLVYWILKSSNIGSRTNSPNAQAYNETDATIIRIGIAWRERGCDSKNFSTRITYFRVTVEKIWKKEVLGVNQDFGKFQGHLWKILWALLNWIQNMEQREGSMCKFGCIRAFLELEIKN
jgi:hypothetical protein